MGEKEGGDTRPTGEIAQTARKRPRKAAWGKGLGDSSGGHACEVIHLSQKPENSPDQERVIFMGGAHQTWCMGSLSR